MFNDRLKECRESLGLSQVDFAEKIGLTKDLYNKYERGNARPSFETLLKIATSLNVSIDYLLGLTDYKNIDDQLLVKKSNVDKKFDKLTSSSQNQILQIFHGLTDCMSDYETIYAEKHVDMDPGYGKYLLNTISQFIKSYQDAAIYLKKHFKLHDVIHKYEETHKFADETSAFFESLVWELQGRLESLAGEQGNIIFLPHALQSVSAGTGTYLEDDDMEKIKVQLNKQTALADYCVTVNGNSMEPVFHDQDVLLIHEQPDVEIDEYGIFEINDEGYVKKRGKRELISLNPEYDNIPFHPDDHIKCFGKVVGVLDPANIL